MGKRILLYGLIAVTVVMIFLFTASTNYLKRSFSDNDNVQLHVTNLNKLVDTQDWSRAELEVESLETAWGKVRKRVQFMGEWDDIRRINESVFKLKAMLNVKDLPGIKKELAIIEFGWTDLGK